MLSREWRCSWSSADRRCSNYIWLINNLIAHWSAPYIRDLTVRTRPPKIQFSCCRISRRVIANTIITMICLFNILLRITSKKSKRKQTTKKDPHYLAFVKAIQQPVTWKIFHCHDISWCYSYFTACQYVHLAWIHYLTHLFIFISDNVWLSILSHLFNKHYLLVWQVEYIPSIPMNYEVLLTKWLSQITANSKLYD